MNNILKVFKVLMVCFILASCARSNIDAGDFNLAAYTPQYAAGFEILGAKDRASTIIVTHSPWQGSDSLSTKRLFIQRNGEDVPDNFNGQVVRTPVQRIVCMSSSYIAMLDAIGEVDMVVGVSGIDFVSNATIQAKRQSIADVGYAGNVNYELLLAAQPDIVLLYGVNGENGMDNKLRELNIPYMYIGEYLEESPLGKAEWLVAIAELIDKRDVGITTFNKIPQRYNELKQAVADIETAPNVMLNTPYSDAWVMPSTKSYIAQLISDARGNYIYAKNSTNQSLPIDMEEAYALVAQSDVWLNVGQIKTHEQLVTQYPKFADTKPVLEKQVWNSILRETPAGGNDFWESGIMHPDLVLQDLIMILHPSVIDRDFSYYKRLE